MTSTAPIDVRDLRARLGGSVVLPTDPEYDEARDMFDGVLDHRPAVIARCTGAADVSAALQYARKAGLEIAVRGGGHGHHLPAGPGLLVDLAPCASVRVDARQRRAWVGGGATLGALDVACQEHGLAVPAGTVSHTGVGGLTLGGGFGFLTPRFGLTIDNLESAEVVLADGRIVRASADSEPDLFWAIRGGGGNFGVVTEFELRLHPLEMPVIAAMSFEPERMAEAFRAARDLLPLDSADVACVLAALTAAPGPETPEAFRGRPVGMVIVVGFGSVDQLAAVVAPLREAVPPAFEQVSPIPYVALQQMLDAASPWGAYTHTKGLFYDELPDAAIDTFVAASRGMASPLSRMMLFGMGAGYRSVPDDATAFGGRRSAVFAVGVEAVALDPTVLPAEREWSREAWRALLPFAADSGAYVNLDPGMDAERIRASYGDKYARLARIKAEYDPENLFHVNANIRPA